MRVRLTMTEYNADWALSSRNFHPRSEPGYLTLEDTIKFFGTLGIDGLELFHPYWESSVSSDLQHLADDAGLSIFSYIFFVDLALPIPERTQAVDHVFAILDRTAELGASLAMIVPGLFKDQYSLDDQRMWMIEGLQSCASRAATLGLMLASENIDDPSARPLMGRGRDCHDICAEVDSTSYRLIYDAGAALHLGDDPLHTLHDMAPYMCHVHVKNSRRMMPGENKARYLEAENGKRFVSTTLDAGEVDLVPIVAELSRIKYDGHMLIEYQGQDDPRMALERNVRYLHGLLDGVDSV